MYFSLPFVLLVILGIHGVMCQRALFNNSDLLDGTNGFEGWAEITVDDFENGWGSYDTIVGSVGPGAPVSSGATLVGGAACLSGKGYMASFFHYANYNVLAFSDLRVTVTFTFHGMDAGDRLFIDYSSDRGAHWKIMKRYGLGNTPLKNNVTYTRTATFSRQKSFYLTEQAKIRVRARAIGDGKSVCIENIKFEGLRT